MAIRVNRFQLLNSPHKKANKTKYSTNSVYQKYKTSTDRDRSLIKYRTKYRGESNF